MLQLRQKGNWQAKKSNEIKETREEWKKTLKKSDKLHSTISTKYVGACLTILPIKDEPYVYLKEEY